MYRKRLQFLQTLAEATSTRRAAFALVPFEVGGDERRRGQQVVAKPVPGFGEFVIVIVVVVVVVVVATRQRTHALFVISVPANGKGSGADARKEAAFVALAPALALSRRRDVVGKFRVRGDVRRRAMEMVARLHGTGNDVFALGLLRAADAV